MVHHSVLKALNRARTGVVSHSSTQPARRSFYPALLMLLTLVCAAVFLVAAPVQAPSAAPALQATQTAAQQPLATTYPDPPGTIDGAKNPELIPDEVALRMIVLAVAEPAIATDAPKERARAKLSPIGLSDDDAAAFMSLLAEYQTQADTLDRQAAAVYSRSPIPHPASTDYQQLVDLGKQKSQLATSAVAAIPARLSDDGLAKLRLYLPQAKKGMKIIPDMPMPK